jgi:hypothetical protein
LILTQALKEQIQHHETVFTKSRAITQILNNPQAKPKVFLYYTINEDNFVTFQSSTLNKNIKRSIPSEIIFEKLLQFQVTKAAGWLFHFRISYPFHYTRSTIFWANTEKWIDK